MREKALKNDKKSNTTRTRAKQKEKKTGNRNTHVYVSWSLVTKLCL